MIAPGQPGAPVRTVTIVGGGTAGWMTAALLSRLLVSGWRIRLVESDEIGTVGVGEATIPALRNFNALAGIDEHEMMRATQGTYKLGIEFVDWRAPGTSYVHGFGKIGQDLMWFHPHQLWLKMAASGKAKPFDRYALNCMAARQGRFCYPDPTNPTSPMADLDYAFHFDASLYAAFLRRRSEAQRVERIEGRIVEVRRRAEDGFVDTLVLADGRLVGGDLFVDCSGMAALLIGRTLGIGYEDWSHWLPCVRAVAVPSERGATLPPFTRSTARSAGWQWRIPLQHRTGNGHVYSSAHMDDEAAAALLMATLETRPLGTPRPIRFRPGRRLKAWDRNVVAVGLSGGFIEPLESTSIHLIQTAILRLLALFPGRGVSAPDVDEYNRQTAFEMEDIRDFIIAHYKVTDREDTPFWSHVKHMAVPDSLAARLELFRSSARFFVHGKAELFKEESWVQVLIGQGLAMRPDPMLDMLPDAQLDAFLADVEEVVADCAAAMPTHDDFIARFCRASAAPHRAPVSGGGAGMT